MTKARRLVALLVLISGAAIVSSYTLGQSGAKKGTSFGPPAPQLGTGKPLARSDASAEASPTPDRFTAGGVLTYQPVRGDMLFALQVKHDLKERRLPRDYVILVSTSAAMAGPGWIGARQITEGIIEKAKDRDQVSIWFVGDQGRSGPAFEGFRSPADAKEKLTLTTTVTRLKDKEYPSGMDDLKTALGRAIDSLPHKAGASTTSPSRSSP